MSRILKYALGVVLAITRITAFSGDTVTPQVTAPDVEQIVTKQVTTTPTPSKTTSNPTT